MAVRWRDITAPTRSPVPDHAGAPVVEGNDVRIDQPFPETQAGREAALEIRQGLFKGLSVEFRSIKENIIGGVRRIREAVLVGAGLVDSPAYAAAVVTAEARAKAEAKAKWERREVIT